MLGGGGGDACALWRLRNIAMWLCCYRWGLKRTWEHCIHCCPQSSWSFSCKSWHHLFCLVSIAKLAVCQHYQFRCFSGTGFDLSLSVCALDSVFVPLSPLTIWSLSVVGHGCVSHALSLLLMIQWEICFHWLSKIMKWNHESAKLLVHDCTVVFLFCCVCVCVFFQPDAPSVMLLVQCRLGSSPPSPPLTTHPAPHHPPVMRFQYFVRDNSALNNLIDQNHCSTQTIVFVRRKFYSADSKACSFPKGWGYWLGKLQQSFVVFFQRSLVPSPARQGHWTDQWDQRTTKK